MALLAAGCGPVPAEVPTAPAATAPSPAATAESGPTATASMTAARAPAPTAPAAAASETAPASEPTAAAVPTASATSAPATPTSAPATVVPVAQPPYAASACSDKYPCDEDVAGWLARIRVPAGFGVEQFARVDDSPTSLAFGPDGRLYVATMSGAIMAIDQAGRIETYVEGFLVPTGIAFAPAGEALYVAARVQDQTVDGEAALFVVEGGKAREIVSGLPCCYTSLHAANGIAFGPDGNGYVAVGARADHGEILFGPDKGNQDELQPLEAAIVRFSPDGTEVVAVAYGLRNAYDIAWDSAGRLWATDNAPDFGPPDELHQVILGAQHGYPWYACEDCFAPPAGVEIVPPVYEFVAHAAPTGILAYQGEQFPGYHDSLFVALWSAFPGAQKIVRFAPGGVAAADFATGFAAPIDIAEDGEGSLYVADWATGIIFKISYLG